MPSQGAGTLTFTADDAVANVGVYGITVRAQKENTLNIGFDILNRGSVQSGVIYNVSIFKKSNPATPVAQNTYDADVVHLAAGETVHKDIVYTAPTYLKGEYTAEVNIKTADGLVLAKNRTEVFSLSGSGEGVFVDTQKCYVTVDGADTARYTLSQGVDMTTDESLTMHCAITSDFSKEVSVTPVIETRYRSVVGKIVSTEKQAALTLAVGKTVDFTAKLPKVTEPQSYDATLSFVDSNNQLVSTVAVAHYVVQGQSATIQNFSLDKESYVVGDAAKATLVWSGAAGNFPGARKATEADAKLTRTISIQNDQKQACAKDVSQNIDMNTNGGKEDVTIAITAACVNPIATVKIVGANGKVLAQNTYATQSKGAVALANGMVDAIGGWAQAFVYGAAFLIILILLVYLMKKNHTPKKQAKKRTQTRMKMLLGLLVGAGALVSGGQLHAETYTPNVWWTLGTNKQIKAPQSFYVDLDNGIYRKDRVYNAGSRMPVIANASLLSCDNTFGGKITATNEKLDGTVLGGPKTIFDGRFVSDGSATDHKTFKPDVIPTQDFIVPTEPGTYQVTFILYDYVLSYASQEAQFGKCSSYIQINPAGEKICGDVNGAIPHEIGRATLQYKVDPNLAETLADPKKAACSIIENASKYVCANNGYLDPITGACGPAGTATTLHTGIDPEVITNTGRTCDASTVLRHPTAAELSTVCPQARLFEDVCSNGVLTTKPVMGTSTNPSCLTLWQETPSVPQPR